MRITSYGPPVLASLVLLASFNAPSQAQVSQEIQNLRAFGKLYGYVKYFHPSDEAARVSWAAFAIYGVRAVRSIGDRADLRKTLDALFKPIAPTAQIFSSDQTPPPSGPAHPSSNRP